MANKHSHHRPSAWSASSLQYSALHLPFALFGLSTRPNQGCTMEMMTEYPLQTKSCDSSWSSRTSNYPETSQPADASRTTHFILIPLPSPILYMCKGAACGGEESPRILNHLNQIHKIWQVHLCSNNAPRRSFSRCCPPFLARSPARRRLQ